MIRVMGLSATLPNFKDVATFLGVNHQKGLFVFDSSYRPTPLEQTFVGVREKRPNRMNEAYNEPGAFLPPAPWGGVRRVGGLAVSPPPSPSSPGDPMDLHERVRAPRARSRW